MPFQRPTLQDLITRVEIDLQTRMPNQKGGLLRRSVLAVIARVQAGVAHMLYGFFDWLARQILPDTAETEWLERHASLYGIVRTPAAAAGGTVTFTGTDSSVIPAGTTLVRNDGVEYTTDAEGTISGGSVDIDVTASEAGTGGNANTGVVLSLASPISGVDSEATVASSGITDGIDTESDDDLRARLLQRIRQTPQGGAENDYERWALEVAGVTRAFIYPAYLGPGTVGVTFVMDNQAGSIIPSGAKVTEVQDYIDERRPVTADVTVFAPVAVPLNFTIALTPDTTTVRDAVEAELKDLLIREGEPGATILRSHIREAISIAEGETDHDLVAPAGDVTHDSTEIAVFGTITWQ